MKKKKLSLAAIWATTLSFSSKVMGQLMDLDNMQDVYGVPPIEQKINIIIKIAQRVLVGITPIIGIVNLIKIRKIDDKIQKKRKVKKTIIIIAILLVILVAAFLVPTLLLK